MTKKLKHKSKLLALLTIIIIIFITIIGILFFFQKKTEKQTISPEAKKTLDTYKNTFPNEVKTGPAFEVKKRDVMGRPESYTIKSSK